MSDNGSGLKIFMALTASFGLLALAMRGRNGGTSRSSTEQDDDDSRSSVSSDDRDDEERETITTTTMARREEPVEDDDTRRTRLAREAVARDRELEEIEMRKREIEERMNAVPREKSIDEVNRELRHDANVRQARIIVGEDISTLEETRDKVAVIERNLEIVVQAGDQPGKNRPELTDEAIQSTFEGMHQDAKEAREELDKEIDKQKTELDNLDDKSDDDLEDRVFRRTPGNFTD